MALPDGGWGGTSPGRLFPAFCGDPKESDVDPPDWLNCFRLSETEMEGRSSLDSRSASAAPLCPLIFAAVGEAGSVGGPGGRGLLLEDGACGRGCHFAGGPVPLGTGGGEVGPFDVADGGEKRGFETPVNGGRRRVYERFKYKQR